ncbi:MAG TPA: hypothetical protein VG273_17425 [Bryobacteraceae bacterium]|nr:hypothetical protein [Bryobacteraceae bacterium]
MRTVVGVFASREEANGVLRDLNAIGIPPDEVAIAEGSESKDHEKEWSRRNLSAAAASAFGWMFAGFIPEVAERDLPGATAFGATIGAVGGALSGLAFNAIRVNSVGATSEPIVSALVGLVIAGGLGGLAAAYYNMGVSHERVALEHKAEVDHGVIVAAHVIDEREPDAVKVMNAHHATKTRADADPWLASGWTGAHPTETPYPSDSEYKEHAA